MKINIGPTQPPQRKGHLPQYSKDKLHILQDKCNELEALGVLRKPEEINITMEYLHPSFLVSKPNCGHRLVTAALLPPLKVYVFTPGVQWGCQAQKPP